MAQVDVSPDVRSHLRQFLIERFNLSELKDLCFDLGVDYEMFPHQTKGEFSRELLAYYERSANLSCLVAEVIRLRPDDEMVELLAELPGCSPRTKVQIVLPGDKLKNRKKMLSELAKVLGVAPDEVMLLATAPGSIRLLVSLPTEPAERLIALNPDHLGDAYEISSISAYDSLSSEAQDAWRAAALEGKPPLTLFGLSGAPLVLVIVAAAVLVAGGVVIAAAAIAAPRVVVTNNCATDINQRTVVPVFGEVKIELASGESRPYAIPPGAYEFKYDGHQVDVFLPLGVHLGPYQFSGDINAFYEGQPILANQPLHDTIGLRDRPEIELCPSGR